MGEAEDKQQGPFHVPRASVPVPASRPGCVTDSTGGLAPGSSRVAPNGPAAQRGSHTLFVSRNNAWSVLDLSGHFYNLSVFPHILIPPSISLNTLNFLIVCWSDNSSSDEQSDTHSLFH